MPKIARGRRRINHYYFIKDREFGVGNWVRISSYAPFAVTACFNGHNFVAQQLHLLGCPYRYNSIRLRTKAMKRHGHQAIVAECLNCGGLGR